MIGHVVRIVAGSRRSTVVAALVVAALGAALVSPRAVMAQVGAGNFTASLSLDPAALPPGFNGTFGVNDPIPVLFVLKGPSFFSYQGFLDQDFLLLLQVTDSKGQVSVATTPHLDFQVLSCIGLDLGGGQSQFFNQALLVSPAETATFPAGGSGEKSANIVPAYPSLTPPGTYVVRAVIPFKSWDPSKTNPREVFTNCLGISRSVADLAAGTSFTVVSNPLVIKRCCFTTFTFAPPIDPNGVRSFNGGNTIPVKFSLSLNGTPIIGASARLFVALLPGGQRIDLGPFRFDQNLGNYLNNWNTKGFALGDYNVFVDVDDGSEHVAKVRLR
jgi:hypothetical protein